MNGLLVRVGADLSAGGGSWNGPVDGASGEFAYVAIPENSPVHPGLDKPYSDLAPTLARFGVGLPEHLRMRNMHLDPDFEHLTYGDQRERAKQLRAHLRPDDLIVFYAGFADTAPAPRLGENDGGVIPGAWSPPRVDPEVLEDLVEEEQVVLDRLAEGWTGPGPASGIFAGLEDHCRRARRYRQELQRLQQHVAALRNRVAAPEEAG